MHIAVQIKSIVSEISMAVHHIMEIGFNIGYLISICLLLILMVLKTDSVPGGMRRFSQLFIFAFLLLALGDTGHVGFRVYAYLKGGLEYHKELLAWGSFATAFTVTLFYMLMLELNHRYSGKARGSLYRILMGIGIARLLFILLPGNNWSEGEGILYSYIRNGMLTLLGLSVAILFIKADRKKESGMGRWFGIMILISYGFYLPVILFAHILPVLGFLMIPKTCAYVAVAIIGYREIFLSDDTNTYSDP